MNALLQTLHHSSFLFSLNTVVLIYKQDQMITQRKTGIVNDNESTIIGYQVVYSSPKALSKHTQTESGRYCSTQTRDFISFRRCNFSYSYLGCESEVERVKTHLATAFFQ